MEKTDNTVVGYDGQWEAENYYTTENDVVLIVGDENDENEPRYIR